MTNIYPTIISQTSTEMVFNINNLDDDKGVYVLYDIMNLNTSTGSGNSYRGNYYIWRCKSATSGQVTINSASNINQSLVIDYSTLDPSFFTFMPHIEYIAFDMFSVKVDMVSRRYPETFEKKFSLREMDTFLEASLADINLYPPMTSYWFAFSDYDDEIDIKINPYSLITGIPFEWMNLLASGALLNSLIAEGIFESNINFGYSDQGINITYNNIDPIKSWWTSLAESFTKEKDMMKKNYWHLAGVGTTPFALGIQSIIQTTMGALSTVGMPWWRSAMGRPS